MAYLLDMSSVTFIFSCILGTSVKLLLDKSKKLKLYSPPKALSSMELIWLDDKFKQDILATLGNLPTILLIWPSVIVINNSTLQTCWWTVKLNESIVAFLICKAFISVVELISIKMYFELYLVY